MKRLLAMAAVLAFCASAWAEAPPRPDELAGPMGTVKVASAGLSVTITGPKNVNTGNAEEVSLPIGQEVKLPPASYNVTSVALLAHDAQKNLWVLSSTKTLGRLGSLLVTAGQTTTVEGGAPLEVKATVKINSGSAAGAQASGYGVPNVPGMSYANTGGSGSSTSEQKAASSKYGAKNQGAQGKTVTVLIKFVGRAGEEYSTNVQRGKSPGPAPTIRILDDKNNVLAQGTYSCGTTGGGTGAYTGYAGGSVPSVGGMGGGYGNVRVTEGYIWRVPANFKGQFRVEVISTMPFPCKQDTTTNTIN
jgi:hypothetical protein